MGLARQKALLRLLTSTNWAPNLFFFPSRKHLEVRKKTFARAVSPCSVPLALAA